MRDAYVGDWRLEVRDCIAASQSPVSNLSSMISGQHHKPTPERTTAMGEEQKSKGKKRGKKLELNKETVQELTDEQLGDVAGGALKTGGGHCKDQSLYP